MVDSAGIMTDALTWAGTYHGIGARLLREYAEQMPIGRRANDPRRHASFLKSCSACSAAAWRYRSVPRHAAARGQRISVLHAGSSDRRSDICGGAPRT